MVEPPESAWTHEIGLVKQGDEAAARRLVERLYPHVIRIVRTHLSNRSDEQDAAQEVFMRMFAKIGQYRGDQGFDHWVARIAVNHCHDRLRQQRSRRVVTYSDLNVEEAGFVDHLLARQEEGAADPRPEATLALLEKLLASLNEREQLVIRMLDLEQRTVREVAAWTGWGDSKIKVTAMRARRKLAACLEQLETKANPAGGSPS